MKVSRVVIVIVVMVFAAMPSMYAQTGPNADDYTRMAEEFRKSQEPDSAVLYYGKAAQQYKASGDEENVVHAYTQMGVILTRQDDYDKAQAYLDQAIATGISALDTNSLTLATTYISLGVNYAAKEEFEKSLFCHFKALEIRLRQLGENDTQVATSYGNIGNVYFRMKEYDLAIEAHLKAMRIREALFGTHGTEVVQSYTNLGNAYKGKGDYPLALKYYQAALENKTLQLGIGHKDLARYGQAVVEVLDLMKNTVGSQNTWRSTDLQGLIEHLDSIYLACNPCQYDAQMYFRSFGEDSFEVRNFTIRLRQNPNNLSYPHDWEITEYQSAQSTLTMMLINDTAYFIYKVPDEKGMNHFAMREPFEPGCYQWTMHDYFVLSEVFAPFGGAFIDSIQMKDSGEYIVLHRATTPFSTRELVIDKATGNPVKATSTFRDSDFHFQQEQIIYFNFENTTMLPDSALNPDFYLHAGYKVPTVDQAAKTEEVKEEGSPYFLTALSKEKLLSYPFVLPDGDFVRLEEEKGNYIILDFWFATCMPCLKAMPELDKLSRKYKDAGLKVFGLNCLDYDKRQNLAEQMIAKGISFPLLFGQKSLVNHLGITTFPSYFIVTPDKDIIYVENGMDGLKKWAADTFKK
jgi:tetratricopeptide (TPR) repeat protein/thiol-disulfide isomerase/thioredoxin